MIQKRNNAFDYGKAAICVLIRAIDKKSYEPMDENIQVAPDKNIPVKPIEPIDVPPGEFIYTLLRKLKIRNTGDLLSLSDEEIYNSIHEGYCELQSRDEMDEPLTEQDLITKEEQYEEEQ
jgi:hypothetical protein